MLTKATIQLSHTLFPGCSVPRTSYGAHIHALPTFEGRMCRGVAQSGGTATFPIIDPKYAGTDATAANADGEDEDDMPVAAKTKDERRHGDGGARDAAAW